MKKRQSIVSLALLAALSVAAVACSGGAPGPGGDGGLDARAGTTGGRGGGGAGGTSAPGGAQGSAGAGDGGAGTGGAEADAAVDGSASAGAGGAGAGAGGAGGTGGAGGAEAGGRGGTDGGVAGSAGGSAGAGVGGGGAGALGTGGSVAGAGGSGAGGAANTGGWSGAGGTSNAGGAGGAGGAAAGGASGAGGTPQSDCGNGVLDAGEACDTAIAVGQIGACPTSPCPRLDVCVPRSLQGSGCARTCVDQARITSYSATPDMCCPPSSSIDPDCVRAYPTGPSTTSQTATNGSTCSTSPIAYQRTVDTAAYFPLAPTCGVPIMLTGDAVTVGGATTNSEAMSIQVTWPTGQSRSSLEISLGSRGSIKQATFLVDTLATLPTFATLHYFHKGCGSPDGSITAFDARPFTGTPARTGGDAARVRLAGDSIGQFIAVEDTPPVGETTVRVLAGQYTALTLRANNNPNVVAPTWSQTGVVTLSTPGANAREPAIAVESRATTAAPTLAPHGHVVWIEDEGSTLMYARVTGDGTVGGRKMISVADRISSPEVVVIDTQELGVVWSQEAAGTERAMFARVSLATLDVLSLGELTAGAAGDAVEPSIGSYFHANLVAGAIAWIDTRSGARQIYFQRFARGGVLGGPAAPVSVAAVEPSNPVLLPISEQDFRLYWTDRRDGHRAVYSKRTNGGVWDASAVDTRMTAAGADAHHVRAPLPIPTVKSNGVLERTGLVDSHLLVWESGDGGNRVRFAADNYNGATSPPHRTSFTMSCAATTASPDAAVFPDVANTFVNVLGLKLAAWADDGGVAIGPLGVRPYVR